MPVFMYVCQLCLFPCLSVVVDAWRLSVCLSVYVTVSVYPEFYEGNNYEGNNSNRSRKRKAKSQNDARCCLSSVVCRVQTTRDTSDT